MTTRRSGRIALVGAALVLLGTLVPTPLPAQRAPRPSVRGPSPRPEPRPSEERIYTLLRHQLRALLEAQDFVRAERGGFARGFGVGPDAVAFVPPAGVTVTMTWADSGGWAAAATHAALPGRTCVIWAGQVPPPRRPATEADQNQGSEAEVVCDLVP